MIYFLFRIVCAAVARVHAQQHTGYVSIKIGVLRCCLLFCGITLIHIFLRHLPRWCDASGPVRRVLRRWASTLEQHVVITISRTTVQLLDESKLQAVAGVGEQASGPRGAAARAVSSDRQNVIDGWIGGTWVSS